MSKLSATADESAVKTAFAGKFTRKSMSKEKNQTFEKKTYNLPNVLTTQFEELAARTGANSDTEIVKSAIRLYLYLHQIMDEGDSLVIHKKEGREIELGLFL